ncbi:MAG: hypothetical protein HQ482_07790 [Sphingomonadales bacterium]|nr:hypothetical protein [Sphingomonadales bacterium]
MVRQCLSQIVHHVRVGCTFPVNREAMPRAGEGDARPSPFAFHGNADPISGQRFYLTGNQ